MLCARLMDFLASIENLPFSIWVRESGSLWAYPGILFMHTVGLGLVAGISAAVALRVLGVARDIPLAPLESFYRVLWLGFWVNAASGVALLMADATTKLVNPVFYVKMIFVALAMIVTLRLRRHLFAGGATTGAGGAKPLAAATLLFWACAITAGRLMAYLGPVSGAPGLSNSLGK
jgi:hypothetical protein